MCEADRTDYENGRLAYFAGAPLRYYDYSGAAYRGWKDGQREHEADIKAWEASGYPHD